MQLAHTRLYDVAVATPGINQSPSYCWICSSQVRGPEVKSALTGSCHFLLQVSPLCSGRGWAEFLLTLIHFFSFYSFVCLGLYFSSILRTPSKSRENFCSDRYRGDTKCWKAFLSPGYDDTFQELRNYPLCWRNFTSSMNIFIRLTPASKHVCSQFRIKTLIVLRLTSFVIKATERSHHTGRHLFVSVSCSPGEDA